ncbi:Tn3 family transposase [Streptomyces sp. NPDC052000]|uniref:Tn3 family transposase n=1 Tax=Streptomyces sp. NPDC052000 TaxID=3155676 RepID=UPI00344FAE4C
MIFHNALDIAEIIRQLLAEGWEIDPEDLAHISPYLTEHIKRSGEYSTHELGIQPEAYETKLDVDFTQLRDQGPRPRPPEPPSTRRAPPCRRPVSLTPSFPGPARGPPSWRHRPDGAFPPRTARPAARGSNSPAGPAGLAVNGVTVGSWRSGLPREGGYAVIDHAASVSLAVWCRRSYSLELRWPLAEGRRRVL